MAVLGIVGNPPGVSEKEAWERVCDVMDELLDADLVFGPVARDVRSIRTLAMKMLKQVRRGVHVNGRHASGGTRKMSSNVQAIIYVHEADGKNYVHGFGDADITPRVRGNALVIEGLKSRTNVEMFAEADGSVSVRHRDDEPVWEDMP